MIGESESITYVLQQHLFLPILPVSEKIVGAQSVAKIVSPTCARNKLLPLLSISRTSHISTGTALTAAYAASDSVG